MAYSGQECPPSGGCSLLSTAALAGLPIQSPVSWRSCHSEPAQNDLRQSCSLRLNAWMQRTGVSALRRVLTLEHRSARGPSCRLSPVSWRSRHSGPAQNDLRQSCALRLNAWIQRTRVSALRRVLTLEHRSARESHPVVCRLSPGVRAIRDRLKMTSANHARCGQMLGIQRTGVSALRRVLTLEHRSARGLIQSFVACLLAFEPFGTGSK